MMDATSGLTAFDRAFARCPLVAILRGIRPEEAGPVALSLHREGIRVMEVPLNSPSPLESIRRMADTLGESAVVGAGTVLREAEVDAVAAAGGALIVSPNMNPAVIRRTKALGLVSAPGVMSPTECIAALEAGADLLKLFPGELIPPAGVKAMSAVLPRGVRLVLVGGVSPQSMAAYAQTPVSGYGIGSALYQPGLTADEVGARARGFVDAWRRLGGPAA